MINERLLQFIWQFQYFNKLVLQTTEQENLQIIYCGAFNKNQGPDFSEAKIKINETTLIGNIELHVKASDWNLHRHFEDQNYGNIILHVIWENDKSILDNRLKAMPALELQPLVSNLLLSRYDELMRAQLFVPCEKQLPVLTEIGWLNWKERLVVERLQRKSKDILLLLKNSNNHWEEIFWWMLAKNFGIKVNAEFFECIAKTISINILAKHKNQIHQLEALLFGQANLLNSVFEEDYPNMLQREYLFLSKKNNLVKTQQQPMFLRMRPANFPTVRLAQLAMLIHNSSHLFSKIKEAKNLNEVKTYFDITANDYWHYHYRFDEATDFKIKSLGMQMIENIIINTVVPVLFSFGLYMNEQIWKDKAILFLNELKAEKNNIIESWKNFGVNATNAMDSQALLELKKFYCDEKRCLDCSVGNKLLK